MTNFTIHTPESAPAGSREKLQQAQSRYGRVPNVYGVLAEAPIAVEAYDVLGSLLMRSSFGDLKPTTNVRNLARLFMSAHQGLALIGRVTETPAVTRGIVDGALAVLETA